MTGALVIGGKMLLLGGRAAIVDSGAAVPSGGAATITGVDVPPEQVYQSTALGTGPAAVPVSATYTGTAGTIQASVFPWGGSALAAGATWQTISASGGTASGTISVPRGGGYALAFRDAVGAALWVSQQRFYVGDNCVLYGQSNMAHWFAAGYGIQTHSNPRARRQAGGGWNLVTNDSTETGTFNGPPPSAYQGVSNPAVGISGEIISTQGREAGIFVDRIIGVTDAAVGVFPYAVGGTASGYWNPTTGAGWAAMLTQGGVPGAFDKPPFAFDASFSIRYQGETDCSLNAEADLPAAMTAEIRALWTATGRDASSFRFGLVSLASVVGYGTPGAFGIARAGVLAFVDDSSNGAYYAGNPIDLPLGGSDVHITDIGFRPLTFRMALTTLIALGHTVAGSVGAFTTGAGPRITSITRSGSVLTLHIGDMDGSTALVMGDGGSGPIGGFRVFDSGGAAVTIASTAISGATIVLTLSGSPSFPVTVDHQMADSPYGTGPDYTTIPYGNNVVPGDSTGAPLWPFAAVSVA